ncbi:AbfB domain-containing protein [Streptosporangium pseudovulgare]|uniref:Alpha-L-arabinofuranosidase B arabinose-binding domain-containing protein n=1 Tax=Streptosporangium pseudovulgare TaxID=35765 RepID=A0ABQ2R4K4_9ACTN|nr:AbfB domain-containing protein [Streptosporangium pseudovulgare]GGQ10433.1 hypothetical protein GCM10010140_46050 [Streptosporangium pseudovulgare]
MALSRRDFTRAALASAALAATGAAGLPRPASAATHTAYVFAYFTESPSFQGADYGLHLAVSRDGLKWTPLNQRDYAPPLNSKHGSIAQITDAEYNALVTRRGTPGWVRLKSSNLPDRYVRHLNGVARIDAYPFDPYRDQMWRMVPGLADASGVSFESVNVPGGYLRHYNYELRLAAGDDSSTFRADATFHRVAGLADPAWTSFRSYNYPARHIRHSDHVLRIDELSASSPAADRQDATFRVTS